MVATGLRSHQRLWLTASWLRMPLPCHTRPMYCSSRGAADHYQLLQSTRNVYLATAVLIAKTQQAQSLEVQREDVCDNFKGQPSRFRFRHGACENICKTLSTTSNQPAITNSVTSPTCPPNRLDQLVLNSPYRGCRSRCNTSLPSFTQLHPNSRSAARPPPLRLRLQTTSH